MKHHLIPAIIMAFPLVPSIAQAQDYVERTFSAVNDDGVTIYYHCYDYDDPFIPRVCSVTNNGSACYSGHISIPPYAMGYEVTYIGRRAFESCTELLSVEIPNTVTGIGEEAFAYCHNLASVTLQENLVAIDDYAFSECDLTSITISKSVSMIGSNPFSGCPLTSIEVKAENAFYNSDNKCNAIIETRTNKLVTGCKNTIIPETVTSIGDRAFYNSTFKSINIPNSVRSIGSEAFAKCGFKTITIPENVTAIKSGAFSECWNLEEVKMGDYVSEIEKYAFGDDGNLKSITIPASVRYIGESAFFDCLRLESVYTKITNVFPIDIFVFRDGTPYGINDATLYVPYGLVETYKNTIGWDRFSKYKEMKPDEPIQQITPFNFSCNKKGSVSINGTQEITGSIDMANIIENSDNTFTFTPKPNCRLDQVILNGLDITSNVEGNTLTCTIPANSQMIVTFTSEQGDMNNDGTLDISDVVSIVNKILGN